MVSENFYKERRSFKTCKRSVVIIVIVLSFNKAHFCSIIDEAKPL